MAIKIRNYININGIKIKNNGQIIFELKMTQKADNTILLLSNINDIGHVVNLLNSFAIAV